MGRLVRVSVLVPYRADGGRRDELWHHVRERWTRETPTWPVYEGNDDVGPFNRSLALNRAAAAAGAWDIAVIADADTLVDTRQLERAVRCCAATAQITFAYERYCYVGKRMSDAILSGFDGDYSLGYDFTMTGTCSSMVVVPRPLWEKCRGFDENFVGWGGEDVAFSLAAQTFGGGYQRELGDVWHLWHEPAAHDPNGENMPLMNLYAAAHGNVAAMAALVAGHS